MKHQSLHVVIKHPNERSSNRPGEGKCYVTAEFPVFLHGGLSTILQQCILNYDSMLGETNEKEENKDQRSQDIVRTTDADYTDGETP